MRILHIQLKNLNSLVGEWTIDLTDPAFTSDGLFAITGPTGAGKSTLLDAICLALYGQTPRLGRISKSSNEILSRHTGECSAEVTFETATGRWRCHWAQHRSRKKASGELQNPKHELVKADTGEIIESSLRGVAEQIERITGMDFERFTRSMLLAQGGFAAFLQSSPDERSPLLEQITGTAIYSDISKLVHEKHRAARLQLEQLQTALQGVQPLSEEEVHALHADVAQHDAQAHTLATQLQHAADALHWHTRVQQLYQALAEQTTATQALAEQQAAFAPARERLHASMRAQELAPAHQRIQTYRQHIAADAHALAQWQQHAPTLELACAQAAQATQTAEQTTQTARAEWDTAQPFLLQARELDWRIAEDDRAVRTLHTAWRTTDAEWHTLNAQQQQDQTTQQQLQQRITQLQHTLQERQANAALVEQLAVLHERLQQLTQAEREQARQAQLREQAEHAAQTSQHHKQQCEHAVAEHHQRQTQAQQALQHAQAQGAQVLAQQTLHQWHQQLARVGTQRHAIEQALHIAQQLQQLAQQHHTLQTQQAELGRTHASQTAQLQALDAVITPSERELHLLQRQLELEARIQSLEAHRTSLHDGSPCPLCGALEHPYAHQLPAGAIPHTRDSIDRVQTQLHRLTQERETLRIAHAKTHATQEWTDTELQRLEQHRTELANKFPRTWQEGLDLPFPAHSDATAEQHTATLQQALATNTQTATQIQSTIEHAQHLEAHTATLRTQWEHAHQTWQHAQQQAQTAHLHHEQAQNAWATQRQSHQQQVEHTAHLQHTLRQQLQVYGINEWTTESAAQTLTHKRDQWLAQQRNLHNWSQQHTALVQTVAQRHARLEAVAQQRTTAQRQHQSSEAALQQLRQTRQTLLNGQAPDAVQAQLQATLNQAQKTLDDARAHHQQTTQTLAQAHTRHADIRTHQAEQQALLDAALQQFAHDLATQQLDSETHYMTTLLPQQERAALAEQAQQLELAQAALHAQRESTQAQLTQMHAQAASGQDAAHTPTAQSAPAWLEAQRTWQTEQRQLQEARAALQHRLRTHADLQARMAAQLHAIEAQQRETQRWDQLHALIGSADGKKYRNFAQGLTFEVMVRHANQQLRTLSDRYLLVHDATQPLTLNVVDTYQNAEVRSTKTLSGGEGFLVSLALALGLSRMASHTVRVDSLFLDEGFGTLDEEALETALETLASLQQEGKLIGVISHIAALKDRIATQIQITPLSGGKSALQGPGCSFIAAS